MTESGFSKIDIIIIIILCLLVAFIIGFNIIQIVDNKLSSVVINVPPSKCTMPPIYVNLTNDKKGKLDLKSSSITVGSESSKFSDLESKEGTESFSINYDYDEDDNSNYGEQRQDQETNDEIESFGNLTDNPESTLTSYPKNANLGQNNPAQIAQKISNYEASTEIEMDENEDDDEQNPNFNNYNNIPYLVDPDLHDKGFYYNKVKLINNKDSPLLKLENKNLRAVQQKMNQCDSKFNRLYNPSNNINFSKNYSGYNQFVDLQKDSYANVTAIGKNLIVPYTSYPVPS